MQSSMILSDREIRITPLPSLAAFSSTAREDREARSNTQTAFSTRHVLLPPKPKELDTATLTGRDQASLTTWHRLHSGSGLRRLMVGGRVLRSMATTHAKASTAAAAVSR